MRLGIRTIVCSLTAVLLAAPSLAQDAPPLVPKAPSAAPTVAPATPPGLQTAALTAADVQAWLDGYMPYALQRGDIAGAVVIVVKDGRVLLKKGYGYADVATRQPVDPDTTLFRPGSVSKLFTWTAVMQQVEAGRINLDQDVNTYLDFKIPSYQGRPVTMRNLMTHTGGFEEDIKNLLTYDPKGPPPLAEVIKAHVPARIFPPGEVPAYSNYGAALAGYIVQRVSGQPFDAYIEQHIFAPLGMTHASFRQPLPQALRPLMAKGYMTASGPPSDYEMVGLAPAGSSAVSGGDMAHFMIAHLQDGAYEGQRILQPATAQMMHDTALTTISPQLHRMLLGFYETDRNGHRIISHGGDTRVFHSDLNLFLDDHVGLFIAVNSLGKDGAAGAVRTALFDGFADRYFPGPAAQGRVGADQAKADAALLARGAYESSRRPERNFMSLLNLMQTVTVSADKDGRISSAAVRGLNDEPKRFEEIAPFVWRAVGAFITYEHSALYQDLSVANPNGSRTPSYVSTATGTSVPSALEVITLPSIYREYAGFGDFTWRLTPRLDIQGGLRYSYNAQDFSQATSFNFVPGSSTKVGHSNDNVVTFSASPSYKITPDLNVYLRFASGYQPGGPNIIIPGENLPPTVAADTLTQYEAGFKSQFLHRRGTLNVALFYNQWNNIQISALDEASETSYLDNGGNAKTEGVDASGSFLVIPGLTVGGTFEYVDAYFTSVVPSVSLALGAEPGSPLPETPRFSGSAQANWLQPLVGDWKYGLGAALRLEGSRISATNYFSPVAQPQAGLYYREPAFGALDLNASVSNARYTVRLYAKNITDDHAYNAYGTVNGPQISGVLIQPRTIGVSVDARF